MAGRGRPAIEPGRTNSNKARPLKYGPNGQLVAWETGDPKKLIVKWRATGTARLNDGTRKRVSIVRDTKIAAETALTDALENAVKTLSGTSHLKRTDTVKTVAGEWYKYEQQLGTLTARSLQTYNSGMKLLVGVEGETGPIGALAIQELTTSNMKTALAGIFHEHGKGAATNARKVLSRVYMYAIENNIAAERVNPVRDIKLKFVTADDDTQPDQARAIPDETLAAMFHAADTNPEFQPWDVGDIMRFMLGTGARIGEALAAQWEDIDLSGKRAKITVGHKTLQNIAKSANLSEHGLSIHHRKPGSTKYGKRTLTVSEQLTEMLKARQERQERDNLSNPHGVVFPNVKGGNLRDDSNTRRQIKKVMDSVQGAAGYTPHNFRDTAITKLLDNGATNRQASDFAGHRNLTTTMNRYVSRGDTAIGDLVDVLDVAPKPLLKSVS